MGQISEHQTTSGNAVGGPSSSRISWSTFDVRPRCRSLLTDEDRRRIERNAFAYASTSEAYDIALPHGSFLSTPCRQVLLNVLPHRRYWHIPGSLPIADDLKDDAIAWLKRVAERQRSVIAVYSASEADAQRFADAGYEVTKFAEEPVIDLGDVTWKGKPFDWVRRQTNFCRRAGLEAIEITDEAARHKLGDELVTILREDLQWRTYAQPLQLLEGQFDPYVFQARRLFVARHTGTGRIEAFLACNPMDGGEAWAFETYRKRQDATKGAMPFLFREAIDKLQAEGVRQVSLCLVPGRNMHIQNMPSANRFIAYWLGVWYKRLNFLFNTAGQEHYKSRFRPQFINRYVCVTPRSSMLSILSFLQTTGATSPNVRNLLRNLWKS